MTDITTNRVSTARLKPHRQFAIVPARDGVRDRIPAEPDRDADLVISAAADEIDRLRAEVACYAEANRHLIDMHDAVIDDARKYTAAQAEIARLREALEKICTGPTPPDEGGREEWHAYWRELAVNRWGIARDALTQARAALAPVVAK